MSDTTITVIVLVLALVAVAWFARGRIKDFALGPTGGKLTTHAPADPASVSSVERIKAAGEDHKLHAEGEGTKITDVTIDKNSKNISIKSTTK